MLHALDVGVNAKGVTVITHERGMERLPRYMTVAQWQEIQERRERERLAAQAARLVAQHGATRAAAVKAELAKPENKNLVASVDPESGRANLYLAPRPYFAAQDTTGRAAPSGTPWPRDATGPTQEDAATELEELKQEAARLQAILDSPAARVDEKTSALIQLSRIRDLIAQHETAHAPPTSTGMQRPRVASARVAEVKAVLARPENRNIVASIDDATGKGTAVSVPTPYFKLSPARKNELTLRAKALKLIVADPRSNGVTRTKAKLELEHIQRMLETDGRTGGPRPDRSSADPAGRT